MNSLSALSRLLSTGQPSNEQLVSHPAASPRRRRSKKRPSSLSLGDNSAASEQLPATQSPASIPLPDDTDLDLVDLTPPTTADSALSVTDTDSSGDEGRDSESAEASRSNQRGCLNALLLRVCAAEIENRARA